MPTATPGAAVVTTPTPKPAARATPASSPTNTPVPSPIVTPTVASTFTPVPVVLKVVEETEYWVAYESPTNYALSMTWAGDSLWLGDLFTDVFYRAVETDRGLQVVQKIQIQRDPFSQAIDMAWDGQSLWSIQWGALTRHAMSRPDLAAEVQVSDASLGSPNIHHMRAVAWDGEHLWSGGSGPIFQHARETFALMKNKEPELPKIEKTYSFRTSPVAMDFHDGRLWMADPRYGYVYEADVSNPSPDGELPALNTYSIVESPYGLAWSKDRLWLYDWYTNRIYKIKKLPETSLDPQDDFLRPGEPHTVIDRVAEGDTTWTLAGSPYVLPNGYLVPEGATLTIEPGVRVLLGESDFVVKGVLNAKGEPDKMIVFSHVRWDRKWGTLFFKGSSASRSVFEYLKVQYADNGVFLENSTPKIAHSILRKTGNYGIQVRIEGGEQGPIEIVGNVISQVSGASIAMNISPETRLPRIAIRENRMAFAYGAGPNIGSDSNDPFVTPPEVVVEHNMFENAFRGTGGGFAGVGNVVYRHNLHRNAVSGSGIQVYHPGNEITYNLFEYTFESSVQLAATRPELIAMRGPARTSFRYNTVRYAGWDSNGGDATTVVEFNNFIANPQWQTWGWWWGMGAHRSTGLEARMSNNWWGTLDLKEVRSHIADAGNKTLEYAGNLMPLVIEPILPQPNGIGFVRGTVVDRATGRPISEALVKIGDVELRTNVVGEFFTASKDGKRALTVSTPSGKKAGLEVQVVAGEERRVAVEA